jgi:hypothetical protein
MLKTKLYRSFLLCASLVAVPALSACQTLGLEDSEPTLANMPADLAVDAFLWQGALETLNFLPIASTDPATGRIETGWGSLSGNPAEQVRVIVQIYPGIISANSVAVSVYRQVNGAPAGVDPTTAPTVQEAILLRARQIKNSIDNN